MKDKNNDNKRKLYDALSKDYELGSYEQFCTDIQDDTKRKKLYDATSEEYDYGDYDSFSNQLGFGKADAVVQSENPLTEQDKIRFSANMGQMKRRTEQMMDGFNERMETMREYHENAPLGGGQTAEGKMLFNPESGKLEKTYITPLGNRYTSKGLADMESFRYRQAADMSVGGQLRKANLRLQDLKAKQAERALEVHKEWAEETENNKAPLAAILGAATYTPRQQSDKENRALSVAIRETEELIKNLEEQKDRENGVDVGFWRGFGRTMGDVRTWDFGMGDMCDALTMINADDLKGKNATEGEHEAHDAMMGAIHEKQQAEERYGGNADFWNRAGVMAGYMPSFMLDFVLTGGGFNGLSSFSKGSTRLATKVIGKETAEKMAQQGFKSYIKENGAKGLGRYATDWTIKALGTTADDLLVRAPLMANTVQAGKTTTDIIDRKLGDVVVDGNGNYDFSNDKTWGDAIWQSEANAIIENYSEMFGAHLDPVFTLGNMSKLANVVGAKRIGAVLSKADASALNGIMGQTHQMFNKMGVSDYVGEVSEEYYGQLWRTMLNLDDAYQQNPDGTRTNLFASGQFHGDIWGGMALSMGLMGAGKHTLSAANYASMKHGVNKADAKVNELLGKEVWEPLKAMLDLTTNENIGEVAELIAGDKDFTINEKAAVLDYMERSLNLRGFNLASMAQSRGGNRNESVQQANDSYLDGYNVISSQEMNDAKNMYEYQRARVADLVDESMFTMIEENPIAALEFVNGNGQWNDEDKSSVIDYINAKQVYNGMIQRVRDDIDGRIEQSNSMIDARVNRNTGMIQGATMKQDERKVYVISGKLIPYDDGSGVSVTDSDNSIIIRDSETGALEQVSPDAVLSLDESQDPNEQKELAEQAIVEQFAREAADKIDGKVTFNPGDAYTITGQDGSQMQVQIIANEDGIVDNGDGTVNVSDGVNIFPLAKETIQQQADAANLARVAQFEQQRSIENAERKQEMQEAERPQYTLNDIVSLTDENGVTVRGNITADADADGKYEVFTEAPINGKRVNLFTRDELDNMLLEHNGVAFERPAENESNNGAENIPENDNNAPQNIPAMQRIPKDEQGNPLYEQADSDTAWDAIVEQTEGDEVMAQTVADGMVVDKEEALKKLEKAKSKGGNSIAEKIASEKERKAAIDAAKQELLVWQKIAGTANRRKMEADAERRRIADEAAALRKAEEEKLRVEREEAERIEREALNGVPDMVDDKPQDARARGYRRMNGHKIDRQEPVQALHGKDVSVKFSDDVLVGGRAAVIDANQLQPSHIQGVRNPLHFIDEAQPKERNDEASLLSSRKIAGNVRPEEITSSVTAYTGAPTVNARGEVIQGNNRSDALRQMWAAHSEQAETYKQYLKDHADEFGLQAEDIDGMKHPVLVNMVDVDDAEAINLGQYVAQDTESGGIERIKPKNIMQKMGNDMRSFANLLLASSDEEISFAGLVDANGTNVLKWMMQKGYITPTQYSSAFDSKDNLTAEAKNDLRGIMYQSIFKGGSVRLEEMFNALPVKAQKAILATAFRDYDSPSAERMAQEIQNSIRAYYALSQDKLFTEAKNFKEARMAVESWKRQYQIDDATGESYLPADNFSNFALLLAAMYKGSSQGFMQGMFAEIYDLVQGTQETTLFEEPDNTPRTLAEAINEAVNKRNELLYENEKFEYDGQRRSDVLAGGSAQSQRGQQGSRGDNQTGKRTENGNWAADSGRRIEESDEQRSTIGGNNKRIEADSESKQARYTLSEKKSGNGEYFYQDENGNIDLADIPQEVFDEIGYTKAPFRLTPGMMLHMIERHGKELGISSTDEAVSFVLDVMNNFDHVRLGYDGALIFSIENGRKRTGKRAITILINSDNGKFYGLKTSGYESIGGLNKRPMLWERGAKDVSSSTDAASASVPTGKSPLSGEQSGSASHQSTGLLEGSVIWRTPKDATTSSVERQGLDYEQSIKTETATKDSGITPQSTSSDSKGTNNSVKSSELGEKIAAAEAEVNVNPTEAQKEAGNYKKGHVQVGVFDITIEQPKGSVRSGVDANGNKWETTMQNTYGYIRGTEGVDGDHIDVFLSDDIDGWNGRRVFVVDQYNEDGSFDEHKVMLGFNETDDAEAAYFANYDSDWANNHKTVVTAVNLEDFEKWIDSSHRKTKAFAEYKGVKIEPIKAVKTNDDVIITSDLFPKVDNSEKLGKEVDRQSVITDKNVKLSRINYEGGYALRVENENGDFIEQSYDYDGGTMSYPIYDLGVNGDQFKRFFKQDAKGLYINDLEIMLLLAENASSLSTPKKVAETEINKGMRAEVESASKDYAITPAQYITKRGKVLDMYLVKFNNELRDTVRKHTTMFAKQLKGWWDKEKQGFMMRSKEDAERLAEYATDAQSQPPLSLSDLSEVNDGNVQFAESQLLETSKQEEKQEYSPVWQYSVSVDKETGLTTLKRDDVSGPIPIGDGRFNYTANSPEEMLEIVRNPKNFNQELRDAVETILENKVKIREIVRTEKAEATEQESKPENNPNGNRLVTDERYAELRERMRKKLLGQMNMGIDPETLAIGTEMAVYHIEKGARKFAEYATAMIADLGDAIRPYLKAFYNGARDLPEVAENGLDADMTPYDEVQKFDVANFDKTSIDALATAETVTREAEVEQEAEIAQERIKKSRPARKKNGKKAVNSQQSNELNLFDSLTDNNKNNEHGLQRTDTERSERVLANGNRHEQGLSRGTETGSESEQQTDRGTDNKGEGAGNAVDRTVRPRLSDSLNEQSIEGKRKKEIESNRKLADELKGVTLHLNDKLGGEHEISGIAYYELANVFHCNDNISGPFQATRKEVDAILKVARKNDGRNTFTPKNTHNNHSERGKDHAPTSVDARIEANIKAIELAKQLLENGEQATEKLMQTLRKFSGWGGLGKAFSEGTYYAPNLIAKKLRELLGEKAYQEAVMSANSAYYTPAYVVDTLWDIAEKMGFEGGNILEGSAGIGNILGQMPTHISERSDIHAIEIDGTSGGILSLLYPDAKVEIQGFEQTRIPNGSVDLAITNVPFVTGLRVNDTTGDKDLSKKFHNIHDFCIAKNVRKLREGGLGIFITSNGTLDNSKKLRDWIVSEGGADFVGAFRMHNKTFGGTGVTSDIVVIRKRVNGQKSAHAIDVSDVSGERMAEYDTGETRKVKGKETPVIKQLSMDYNRYFIEHPENMAGEMHFAFEKGDTFRPTSKGLYPKQDKKQEEMLAEFVRSFSAEEFGERTTTTVAEVNGDKKVGEVFVMDGKLYINSTASAQLLEVNDKKVKGHTKVECFEAYTAIKEALAEVLSYQTENESDEGLKPLLDKLNKAYDDFTSTYGHFNKNTAIAFLRNDVDYANVFALEKFEETADEKGNRIQKFDKTDVFSKRVVEKEKEPTPANVKDGIIASIFKFGRVDIPYIAEQLGTGIGEVKKEIIENGYGFENPVTRQMEASYQYLSGNIREKLRQAEENNENGEFDRNIKALQEVMPMEIPAHLIDFTLGSSWIDPKLYEDFVKERTEVDVRFTAVGGTWFMKEPYFTNYEKNRAMGVTSEMLGRTIMGHTLIEAAIQNRSITVSTTKKHYDGTTETITDKEATQACAAKIDEIRQDFKDWARQKMQSDPEMSERMERIYNDMFNNFVPMSIPDEFVPEYFGGASHKFKMRPHQGKAIVRGTQQPLLLAHEVGTGKTFTLISTAMEMRRLGTARKPMIVVQNATVGQFVASAKELYPNAKILTLEEADRSTEGRKNFYAKIRYNDWDMIVVPQSTFEFIPDSEEREMAFVQDKIEEKMLILEKMKEEDPDGKNMITRQAEREIELLEEQLAGLADNASKKRTANDEKKRAVALQNAEVKAMEMLDRRTDDVENFDDMGIDALLVDEAHEYKHLGFATAMQRGVKGVDPSYSKKSQGVFLKAQAVLEKNNGRNVIFATGTPISNTAAEIWTFMRYLMPADTMKEYGIYYFDDFVRNFGNIQQMLEFTTSGKFKENNRFAGYVNLPELVRIWSGVSDTVLTKEAGGVKDKIPEMEGGKAQDLYLPQTRALRSIMKFVKSELEHYEQMSGKEKKENSHIPLTMYGIAKAAAVDARLVQSDAEDDQNSKTNEAVRQTLRSLKETADYKGTVAIFADNYQNKQSGFNLYDDIRNKLIAEGVPADEIVVMRSGMTVKKKLEIFEKVNRGEVRVILGSTFTLGTGVNIQERLHTLIHLDAPNRPMDYTQRNGRILRQGNLHKDMNKPVRILRFGVEDSLDVTAYQRLKTKGAIADSIMNGKQMMNNSMTNRVLEEEEDVFGDTVAQLSGSEYAMLKNNAEKNVRKYASRKKQWETDQTYIHNAKPRLKAFIKDAEKCIEDNSRYLDAVHSSFPDGQFKEIVIGKHRFASVDTMGDFFKEHNKSVIAEMKQMKDGEIAGEQKRELTIQIGDFSFVVTTKLTRQTMRDGATLFNDVERKMTYSCPELGIEDVPVRQNLLRNAIEDITVNVITGKDFAERLNAGEQNKKHNEAELKELLLREGKPFEYEEELAQAKSQLEEYAELMKKELEEKEAKYAEMDATVETANNISTAEEDDNVLYREDDLEEVNDRFNEELEKLTESNADKVILNLGTPSDILLSAGVSDKPMKLYGNKVIKKMKKHGFKLEELKNLPEAVANPIAVFENYGKEENRSVLTELKTEQGNFLVTLSVGRGNDIDFNVVTSIFGKGNNNIIDWIERGFANYINKEKALDYLHHSVLETEALSNPRLSSITKIVESFENPSVERENLREGDGAYTDDEVGFENDPVAKLLGQSRRTAKQRREFAQRERQRMAERVESLAEKLHLDNVEVVTDASVLDGKKQRAKGIYSKSTGKITIVIPNHTSTFDVEQTLLHEAVAHYGLRQLFGEHFDTFLDNVFNNADENIRRRITNIRKKLYRQYVQHAIKGVTSVFEQAEIIANLPKSESDFTYTATEEYLASLAEDTEFENINASWWRQIKDFFLNMLHKIGFEDFRGVTLSDNELRYILWRSYENLAEPGRYRNILGEAADVAKQYELKVGNYAVSDPHHQTVTESDDALYRDGDSLRKRYDRKVRTPNKSRSVKWKENLLYRLKEAYQDSMSALKALQDMISEETGNPIHSFENAYIAENRMSAENKSQAEIYERDFYKPLMKAIQKLIKSGASYEELKSYIIAKHGLERNEEFSKRDAEQDGDTWDGTIARDYSGLTELTGDKDNFTEAAQMIVDEFENKYSVSELWDKINAATKETLRKSYNSGLMSKSTYDKICGMFKYYVPLRGWDCEVASNEYEYMTSNRLMLSPTLKTAEGRTSLADDPLATIGFMAESSIVQGNRNLMKQKFLNFILNNPNELVSVSEQWYVLDNATGEWEARNPVIPEDATGDEVASIVEQFEQEMEALGDNATKKKDGLKLSMHITKREGQEHVVRVKRAGKEYCLYINGNPRAAQAINGLTNPDVNDSSLYKAAKAVKNLMARAFTSMNPAFVVSNLSRDIIWAGTAVAIKENAAYTAKYNKNVTECLVKAQLPRLLVKYRNGRLDRNNDLERYFDEFIRNGGETGFTQLNTVEDYKRNIKRFVKEAEGKSSITQKAWNGLWDSVEFLNRSAEDTTRFMVYMTSRQMGRDVAHSIYDAKEITVNFNKKGSGGLGASVMNFSYIFFNAAIQSVANFGKLMEKHPAKTTMALTLFSSAGFLVPMMNLAIQALLGGDDDDNSYWDLPEWVRRNNLVLYVPWSENGYMTLPLPHEMKPFYSMGEIAYSVLAGKENVEDGLSKAATGFSSMLPIDLTGNGGNVAVSLTPTIGQPFAQIIANTDYFGKPIYRKHTWNEMDPEWTKAYKSTAPWLVDGTRWLNEITGGNNVDKGWIDKPLLGVVNLNNPALIEHLFESYLGGVGKTLNKAQKTLEMLWNEDLQEWHNVPVISSFYQTADERTTGSQINREYSDAVDEMKGVQHSLSGYKNQVRMGNIEYAEKINELINSEVFKRYVLVKGYDKAIRKASDALKLIDPTQREEVETMIMNLKVEMLGKLEELETRK